MFKKIMTSYLAVSLLYLMVAVSSFSQPQDLSVSSGMMESTLDRVQVEVLPKHDSSAPGSEISYVIILDIEDGWHLNAHDPGPDYLIGVNVKIDSHDSFIISDTQYPQSISYDFSFSDETIYVYEGESAILVKVMAASSLENGEYTLSGNITMQACSDSVCLSPTELELNFPVQIENETIAAQQHVDLFEELESREISIYSDEEENSIATMMNNHGLLWTFAGIFLIGLALNLTPCVYPMMSVTISLFAGSAGSKGSSSNTKFIRALVYVSGIVLMYSLLGVFAAYTGSLFGSWLQSPIVLAGIGVLLLLLSLSMFGLYELQPPAWLMQKMGKTQQIAGYTGFFLSGLMVGIFAAPCIGPPIIALLAFVGSQGNPLFGFFTFFVMALGLGLPYLILGTYSGALTKLPQSGNWMIWIKKLFGVILIGAALFYLSLALFPQYSIHAIMLTALVGGIYLGFMERTGSNKKRFVWIKRSIGIAGLIGAFLLFQNLQKDAVLWDEYDPEQIEFAIKNDMPVMIDFYADWCIPCLELDRRTFTDSNVISETESFVRLKVDLTHFDSEEAEQIRRQYNIAGVPTILFLDSSGNEVKEARVTGFENPESFLKKVTTVE